MENQKAFGAQLAVWRKKLGLNNTELARYIDKAPSSITAYIKGESRPGDNPLALLTLVFNGQDAVKSAGHSPKISKVANVRELVDWVELIGYSAKQLREAIETVLQIYSVQSACPLLDDLQGWPPSPLVTPTAQGITRPEVYVHRGEKLERVKSILLTERAFRTPMHKCVALWGMGGIGKTVMAKAIALDEEIQTYFRDGVLWAELGPQRRQSEQKATHWLRKWGQLLNLGLPENATVWERQEAIRNKLSEPGLRLLIVLDDVWWVEDVEPLLVGSQQIQSLLTVRNRAVATRLPDCALIKVGPVLEPESQAILYAWSGAERQQEDTTGQSAAELSNLVEANALALSLLGSMVKQRGWLYVLERAWSERLRLDVIQTDVSTNRHASVRLALRVSYEDLPEESKAKFRQLGIFPYGSDFASPPLIDLWELRDTGASLKELIARAEDKLWQFYDRALLGLVYQDEQASRFRLHTLLHDYAREQLREEKEWTKVQQRFVNVHTVWSKQLGEGFITYPGAMEAEWANITAAFEYACEMECYDTAAYQLGYVSSYLTSVGLEEEIDRWVEHLKPHFDKMSSAAVGIVEHVEVRRAMTMGDWETAQQINARVMSNPDLPASLQVFARSNEAIIRLNTGNVAGVEQILAQVPEGIGRAVAQAHLLQAKGEIEAASIKWQEVAETSLAVGNTTEAASALGEMADILGNEGRIDAAWQALRQALPLAVKSRSEAVEFQILSKMGVLALIKKQPEDAEIIGNRMLTLLERMSLGADETGARRAYVTRILAGSALQRGNLDEALTRAQEALRLQQEFLPEPDSLASAWEVLAKVYRARGEATEAARANQEAERCSNLPRSEQVG